MRKPLLATVVLMMFLPLMAGCKKGMNDTMAASAVAHVPAVVSRVVAEPVALFYLCGGLLMVAGFVVGSLGNRKTGGALAASGAAMAFFGQVLARHQWVSLAYVLLATAVVVYLAYAKFTAWRAAKASAALIEKHPELKAEMCDGNAYQQEAVRPVFRAVKQELRAEGVIP